MKSIFLTLVVFTVVVHVLCLGKEVKRWVRCYLSKRYLNKHGKRMR
jgi:hypothetical protein